MTNAIIARTPKTDNRKFKTLIAISLIVSALFTQASADPPVSELDSKIILICFKNVGEAKAIARPTTAPVQVCLARVTIFSLPAEVIYIIPPMIMKITAIITISPIRLLRIESRSPETVVTPIGLANVIGELAPVALVGVSLESESLLLKTLVEAPH